MLTFYVLGSDRRFDLVASALEEEGFSVLREGIAKERAVYLLPPATGEEEVLALLDRLAKGSFVFWGRAGEKAKKHAAEKEIFLTSLTEDKLYLELNSRATAEGVLAEVIQKTPCLLGEETVLVCGYGNCGKQIAKLLWLCGCDVWVHSRKGSLAKAKEDGFNTIHTFGENLGMFDLVVNTVPAPIFPSAFLDALSVGTLLFQVASGLSGLDPKDLKERGISFHPLPGLPGRIAPETEADAIFRLIKETLTQSLPESE